MALHLLSCAYRVVSLGCMVKKGGNEYSRGKGYGGFVPVDVIVDPLFDPPPLLSCGFPVFFVCLFSCVRSSSS